MDMELYDQLRKLKRTRYTHYMSEGAHEFLRENKYQIELIAMGLAKVVEDKDRAPKQPVLSGQPIKERHVSETSSSGGWVDHMSPEDVERLLRSTGGGR